jgi:anti-sigma regulatory factor (Ser/Thr protein kinase)
MRTLLSVRLPPDPTAPSKARAALQGLPPTLHPLVDDLQLMVTELVSNSLRYVRFDPNDRIEMLVQEADGRIRVEVKDPGDGHEEALAGWASVRQVVARNDLATGGYGLLIVMKLAARSGVSWDGGTVFWFELEGPLA